jgi:hypothetical protein
MASLPPNYRKADTVNLGIYTFVAISCDDCRFQRDFKGRQACVKYNVLVRRDAICDSFNDRRKGMQSFESLKPTPDELALRFTEPLVEINPRLRQGGDKSTVP